MMNKSTFSDAIDDSNTTPFDTPVTLNLLGNDGDVDGEALTLTQINGQPVSTGSVITLAEGTLTVNADGTVTFDPVRGQYYWHRFFHHQPDLNFDHPSVRRAIVTLQDGRTLTLDHDAYRPLGDLPRQRDIVARKFRSLGEPIAGSAVVGQLQESVYALPGAPDVTALVARSIV